MAEILADIKPSHPDGFIFSLDGGRTTFDGNNLKEALYTALLNIGIQKDEREKRNITFHSWRHFFNTALRSGGIADSKTQKLTGHKTAAMTEHYTHFNLSDFSDVKTLQETLVTQF
jgi:integrase